MGVLELGPQLSVETLKTSCKVGRGRDIRVDREARRKGRVETIGGEERGLFGRRVDVVVEGELGEREVVDPVVLLVRDVHAEVAFECLVGALGEAIRLRVVRCRMAELDL